MPALDVAPEESGLRHIPAPQRDRTCQKGVRTYRSTDRHSDSVAQVAFGQDTGLDPSELSGSAEISEIFKGRAGKSSWAVEDEGEEFLLCNDAFMYTPARQGEQRNPQWGVRKYLQNYGHNDVLAEDGDDVARLEKEFASTLLHT